jgi:hypothetical protein
VSLHALLYIAEWLNLLIGGYFIGRIPWIAAKCQASDCWLTAAPQPKPLQPWECISLQVTA